MKPFHLVAIALLVTTPVAAQSVGEKTGVNSVLGVSPSTPDFVNQVAISDMFEIQSSELAAQRGDAAVKEFAAQMIEAHKKTTMELKSLITSAKLQVTPPAAMDKAHQEMLDELAKLEGAEFNEQYKEDQVEAHENAVSLFERYAEGGDNPALKEWAAKTLPALRHHLEMANKLAE